MKPNVPVYATISADGSRYNVNYHHTVKDGSGGQNCSTGHHSPRVFVEDATPDTPLIDWRTADDKALLDRILGGRGPLDRGIRECAPDNPFCLLDLLIEAERIGGTVTTVGEYLSTL